VEARGRWLTAVARGPHAGPMGSESDPEQVVTEVTRRLSEKHPDTSPIEIEKIVRAEVDELADRPVQDYLAVLTEREAKKKLREQS
jgi:hypothetical protein